mmetsp:Transcript_514/g.1764  ORF Transcript_514/g.1764 Transcript_514/m.1764 type:complete len:88 (+) Transcript_514:2698-2961(+)
MNAQRKAYAAAVRRLRRCRALLFNKYRKAGLIEITVSIKLALGVTFGKTVNGSETPVRPRVSLDFRLRHADSTMSRAAAIDHKLGAQ